MVKSIEAAVAKLRTDPEHPVTAEIDGLVLEVRDNGRRTAADLFREIEPLDDNSAEEMLLAIRESRENARKLEATEEDGPDHLELNRSRPRSRAER
ncbi:MAG TPA: hypothetical protein VFE33_05220 [Thermoanaerobaculia bacterium]|nr:hypothetical protein [Thermoanaerobaculia bacterium]